jgi:hypothetical protein
MKNLENRLHNSLRPFVYELDNWFYNSYKKQIELSKDNNDLKHNYTEELLYKSDRLIKYFIHYNKLLKLSIKYDCDILDKSTFETLQRIDWLFSIYIKGKDSRNKPAFDLYFRLQTYKLGKFLV